MNLFLLFIIAISLSMDAFSLSLAYGTLDITKKEISTLSIMVGIYHFFMPLIGFFLGSKILTFFPINSNFIVFVILCFIGLEMIIDTLRKKDKFVKMQVIQMLIFSFSVSLDSFSVGIGLNTLTRKILAAPIIFSFTSFIFTFLGLHIGKKISEIFGRIATLVGGLVLILIAIMYIV